eukprot:m.209966 g.209966  ORF g.209966 m.209966 type:complete len:61 (-) comp24790_c0_seq1:35-217(-)
MRTLHRCLALCLVPVCVCLADQGKAACDGSNVWFSEMFSTTVSPGRHTVSRPRSAQGAAP